MKSYIFDKKYDSEYNGDTDKTIIINIESIPVESTHRTTKRQNENISFEYFIY